MKAKEFNKISKQFYNKKVKITFYDDSNFIGLFKYPFISDCFRLFLYDIIELYNIFV